MGRRHVVLLLIVACTFGLNSGCAHSYNAARFVPSTSTSLQESESSDNPYGVQCKTVPVWLSGEGTICVAIYNLAVVPLESVTRMQFFVRFENRTASTQSLLISRSVLKIAGLGVKPYGAAMITDVFPGMSGDGFVEFIVPTSLLDKADGFVFTIDAFSKIYEFSYTRVPPDES